MIVLSVCLFSPDAAVAIFCCGMASSDDWLMHGVMDASLLTLNPLLSRFPRSLLSLFLSLSLAFSRPSLLPPIPSRAARMIQATAALRHLFHSHTYMCVACRLGETVEAAGFLIHPRLSFIGATPDGLIGTHGIHKAYP